MSEVIYPRWRYHKDHPAVLVRNAADDDALGDGWGASDVLGPPADAAPINDAEPSPAPEPEPVDDVEPPKRGRPRKATEH